MTKASGRVVSYDYAQRLDYGQVHHCGERSNAPRRGQQIFLRARESLDVNHRSCTK
jgi:hypothetical protein